jgi:hypothetical protein
MHLKEEDLLVYLFLKLDSLLVFDLSLLQHLVDIVVFMNKQIILSPPVLDGLGNFWEGVLNIRVHILFGPLNIFLTLEKNLVDKVFVLNNLLKHFCGFIMTLDEVDNDVIT